MDSKYLKKESYNTFRILSIRILHVLYAKYSTTMDRNEVEDQKDDCESDQMSAQGWWITRGWELIERWG